jgi:hypothetical protein
VRLKTVRCGVRAASSDARRGPGVALAGVLAAAALVGVPAAGAGTKGDLILSNETTKTTFAYATLQESIRSRPDAHAPVMAKLGIQTSDGFVQTYVLLRQRFTSSGPWIQLRIPMRPNGKIGWVPRSALDGFQVVHTEVVVDRGASRLTLFRNGHVIFTAPVGTGKPSTPTPAGHFWITEAFPSNRPAYGPYAFGTSDFSVITDWVGGGIVGLHGTDQPSLVPGHPSHGCIRLHNGDVLTLKRLLGPAAIGTPLLIK